MSGGECPALAVQWTHTGVVRRAILDVTIPLSCQPRSSRCKRFGAGNPYANPALTFGRMERGQCPFTAQIPLVLRATAVEELGTTLEASSIDLDTQSSPEMSATFCRRFPT